MPRCIGLRYKVIAIGHKGLWIIGNKSFVFWWFQVLPRNSCTLGPRKMRLEKNSGYLLHARRTTQCQVCVYSYHRIIHTVDIYSTQGEQPTCSVRYHRIIRVVVTWYRMEFCIPAMIYVTLMKKITALGVVSNLDLINFEALQYTVELWYFEHWYLVWTLIPWIPWICRNEYSWIL